MSKQQIGVVGMAVMGRNLALNIESRGYTVSVFNRSRDKTEEVIAENPGKKLVPFYTVKEFVESLETPRRILLMVKAGAGTDAAIDSLKPYLEKGTSSLMAVIPSSRTPFVVTVNCLLKVSTSSVPVYPVVKRRAERPIHHAWRPERSIRTGCAYSD
jgi:ketopantoate reductase